jgi:glucosamine 6-phosphate synthetase-like amidotransferase/phosphosugar isomerase protein
LTDENLQHTEITSRDIDRQNFSHYFLKEISEAPLSVSKTLQNRWKIDPTSQAEPPLHLDERPSLKKSRRASPKTASNASFSSARVPPAWRPRPARIFSTPISGHR